MKQASNSLLTCFAAPFNRMPHARAPREKASACRRRFTRFFNDQEKMLSQFCFLGLSSTPRSIVRFRLGEGRIRSLFYEIALAFVLLVSVQALVPNRAVGERLLVYRNEDALTVSSRVLLKDAADLRGPDAQQTEPPPQTTGIEPPALGEITVPSRHQIGELVQAVAGPLPSGTFAGASIVQKRVEGRQITADEINPILKSHILQTTSWKESEVAIRSIGNLKGIQLPPTGAEFRISVSGAVVGIKNLLVPLEILQDGKSLRSYWITAEISIHAEVLRAARRIPSGRVVTLDDIEKKFAEIPDLRASYACDPEEVLGKVSRRGLLPGVLLTRDLFADPLLVRSGETVRLRLQRDGIMITSLAKAEQDGRLGQFIKVRSLDFPTLLRAQVSGRAEVKMQ